MKEEKFCRYCECKIEENDTYYLMQKYFQGVFKEKFMVHAECLYSNQQYIEEKRKLGRAATQAFENIGGLIGVENK